MLDVWESEQSDKMKWGFYCSNISRRWESSLKHGRRYDFVECARLSLLWNQILNLRTCMAMGSVTYLQWSFSFFKLTSKFQYYISNLYPKINTGVFTKVFSLVMLLWGLCWDLQEKSSKFSSCQSYWERREMGLRESRGEVNQKTQGLVRKYEVLYWALLEVVVS